MGRPDPRKPQMDAPMVPRDRLTDPRRRAASDGDRLAMRDDVTVLVQMGSIRPESTGSSALWESGWGIVTEEVWNSWNPVDWDVRIVKLW